MQKNKQGGWYVRKSFPHFDLPLNYEAALSLVSDEMRVAKHAFRPFIGFTEVKRRFLPMQSPNYKLKPRDLRYCSHWDGYIHAFYAKKLSDAYEQFLDTCAWSQSVIGYRSKMGTNIHMAKNAFNEIRKRSDSCAIAIDISDFFGSIDHSLLLKNLKRILSVSRLSADWFNVYKSMTRYAWVEHDDIYKKFGIDKKNPPRPLCSTDEFRKARDADSNFVRTHQYAHGIPQGSPISALFSNIYMIDFDEACFAFIKALGGYYRRYSDDIFIVCDPKDQVLVQEFVELEISKLGTAIKIGSDKTEISTFSRLAGGALTCDEPISYLGFTFDGLRVLLRARTLSRYYRRMTYASRGTVRTASKKHSFKVFKRKLYRQFTHLGKANFYSYSKRASEILGEDGPKEQLKNHFGILQRKLRNRGR